MVLIRDVLMHSTWALCPVWPRSLDQSWALAVPHTGISSPTHHRTRLTQTHQLLLSPSPPPQPRRADGLTYGQF